MSYRSLMMVHTVHWQNCNLINGEILTFASLMHIQKHISLQNFNTFGVQSFASQFVQVSNVEMLQQVLEMRFPKYYVLGGGSNLLLTGDLDLCILKNEITGIEVIDHLSDDVMVRVGGGVVWHDLVQWAVKNGLGGIENLSLIPGCVGAAPIQNIGAYGTEQESAFIALEAVDLQTGDTRRFEKNECQFGYRDSIFKRDFKERFMITHVYYRLSKNSPLDISYGAIRETLDEMGIESPTLADVSKAVIAIRTYKLPDPAVLGNSGSFFKNPIVNLETYEILKDKRPDLVSYQVTDDSFKIPAGWLIDQCGWKGVREGNVGCYQNQALVIVNYGGATGSEVWNFAQKVKADVLEKFGIELQPEVNVLVD